MTEHSRSLAGFLHNFKRLFEPAVIRKNSILTALDDALSN